MTKITYIPGEIANAAIDEHGNRKPVTRTHNIFDDNKNKNQEEINVDIDNSLNQLSNEIDAINKQDVISVDTLPDVSTADPKKIYRVVGDDNYTDYMVNASGDNWKKLATYSFPGIDDEPTVGSNNLIKSGGVADKISELELNAFGENVIKPLSFRNGTLNNFGNQNCISTTNHVKVKKGETVTINLPELADGHYYVSGYCVYRSDGTARTEKHVVDDGTIGIRSVSIVWDDAAYVDFHFGEQSNNESVVWYPLRADTFDKDCNITIAAEDSLKHSIEINKKGINNLSDKIDTIFDYAYFAGPSYPTFGINGKSIKITLPTSTLILTSSTSDTTKNITCNGETFTLNAENQVLVYSNNSIVVKNYNERIVGDILLLADTTNDGMYRHLTGLLARYYHEHKYKYANNILLSSCYFNNGVTPVITNGSGQDIVIKMPTEENFLRLYNDRDGQWLSVKSDGNTYTIGNLNKLVVDISDSTFKVLAANSTSENYILLAFNTGGCIAGGYFANFIIGKKGTVTTEKLGDKSITLPKLADGIISSENILYISGPTKPVFSESGDGATFSINVQIPAGNQLRIYSSTLGNIKTITLNTTIKATVEVNQKLIINNDSVYKVVPIAEAHADKYVLLSNSGYSISGLLAHYYYNKHIKPTFDNVANYYDALIPYRNNVAKDTTFKFLFFSDVHKEEKAVDRVIGLTTAYGASYVNAVINGGDTVATNILEGLSWYNEKIAKCSIPVLTAVGNHDAWTSQSPQTMATPQQTYNELMPTVISQASVVQPENAETNGYNFYYKDFANSVRVVVLDSQHAVKNATYAEAQLNWFKNVVLSDTSKKIVAVIHHPFADAVQVTVETNWDKNNTFTSYYESGDGLLSPANLVEAVDNFISKGGTFITWLCGHTHYDKVGTFKEHNNQLVIVINTARGQNNMPFNADTDRSKGTPNYDCMNYMGIDTAKGVIKVLRIGNAVDNLLRSKRCMCYDYVNHKLISNW